MKPQAPFLVRLPAPLFFAITFVASLLLGRLFQWAPLGKLGPAVPLVGWGLFGAGLILAGASVGIFGLRRTTLNPVGLPARLVTDGAFRLSRNPMYVALAVQYVGLSLAVGTLWSILFIVAPLTVVAVLVIPFEEARMRDTFGQGYLDYCRRVRRWI